MTTRPDPIHILVSVLFFAPRKALDLARWIVGE
jgi:hypothetical protein